MAKETLEQSLTGHLSHGNVGIFSEPRELAYEKPDLLAGAAGFEPANAGTKNRCLTTWLRPNRAIQSGKTEIGRQLSAVAAPPQRSWAGMALESRGPWPQALRRPSVTASRAGASTARYNVEPFGQPTPAAPLHTALR